MQRAKRAICGWICAACLMFPLMLNASGLEITLTPENATVRSNIEAHLGQVTPRNTREMRRYARYARTQIEAAVEALGFYQYQIQMRVVEGDPAGLLVDLHLGEPVRLRHVSVQLAGEALDQASFTPPDMSQLQPGMPLNHAAYESAKRHLRQQALTYGYFSAAFEQHQVRVYPEQGVADVWIHFDSGPRYRFGEVTFDHEGHLEERLLRRYVRFIAGMPYSTERLAQLSRDLRESGYFQEVLVDANPEKIQQDRQIPVEVFLRHRLPRSLNLGIGYSTDIGPRVTAHWTQHWLNDRGHSRGVDTLVSEPRQSLGGWYQIPLNPPMTDRLRLTGNAINERFDVQESRRYGAGIHWHHRQSNGWDRVLSLRGEREEYRIADDEGATWLTLPGISYARLQTDRRLDPTRGYRFQVELTGSSEHWYSDVDLAQLTFFARGLTTLWDRHRFLLRAQGGGVATNEFDRVPASLRFFAGGDQSVRGYAYQSLSPRNEAGDPVGGRVMLAGGLEYQWVLTERWRFAVFSDVGNSVAHPDDLGQWYVGNGFGLRWISPVGPLRLDFAHGQDEALGGWRVHFSMGPEL